MTASVSIAHDLHVAADVQRVWSLTTDVERWPSLTPTISEVTRLDDGPLRVGSAARLSQPRLRPATWTVTTLAPPHRFVWETGGRRLRMLAEHVVEAEGAGCRNTLRLRLEGPAAVALGGVGRPVVRQALATENDGFRRAAEGLARPRFVDEHRLRVDRPPGEVWPVVRTYADRLTAGPRGRMVTGLLGTAPHSGFEVGDEVDGRRVGLTGRHRFSRYWLDLRVDPVDGSDAEVAAVTYAEFPGPHGFAYRTAVIGSRLHVVAVRRMLAAIRRHL